MADLKLPYSSLPHLMELPADCRELQTDEDDADLLGVRKDRCSLMIPPRNTPFSLGQLLSFILTPPPPLYANFTYVCTALSLCLFLDLNIGFFP